MTEAADHWSRLSSEQREAVEDRIEAFESAWQRGECPAIVDHLPADNELKMAVLVELVHIDSEFRGKAGKPVHWESYLREFPELASIKDLMPLGSTVLLPNCATQTLPNAKFALTVTVPGYRIVREIGRGGMGVVFEAMHLARDERFAVKVLTPNAELTDQAPRLFLREANILSQLDHPCIVRFHEVGWSNGSLFIVMEYVDQVDLPTLLTTRPTAARIRIGCGLIGQVLAALDFSHRRGLVHRDIKPSNVLVMKKNKKLLAKLSDFGIAKNFEAAGFSAMTGDGEMRGTPAYMAPEQFIDSRRVKPAADIFAVGVTLYHLLAGRLPFDCERTPSGMLKRLDEHTVPLKDVLPEVPERLSQLIQRAMDADPVKRFASAAEMKNALMPFVSSREN
jgi:serine/threonine protein kinase